jgi:uncharacterized LabA/DUF88 family protein
MATGQRWAMYIDGYNFYCAITKNLKKFPIYLGWCNFAQLARDAIIKGRGELVRIKYFTAPVEDFGKLGGELGSEAARQGTWLRALGSLSEIDIITGFHNGDKSVPLKHRHKTRKEKATDVNIALTLVLDAAKNVYDRAILVTGDYDQIPAVIEVANELYRSVEVWLPPGRKAGKWGELANPRISVHEITREILTDCRFPNAVIHKGSVIEAPLSWQAKATPEK